MRLAFDIVEGILAATALFLLLFYPQTILGGTIFQDHSNAGSIKWEAMKDSSGLMPTSYRARIYGGWLVSVQGDLVFISLNSPDGWVLDYEEKK